MANIQFILCDDDKADLEALNASIHDYIKQRDIVGSTVCFSEPEEVLRFSEMNGNMPAVYLLDVVMPELDGIELGRKIRERDKNSAVIYISCSREYSLDAFSVRAFSYLIKPFTEEKLFFELDECLARIKTAEQTLSVKTADMIVTLTLSDIIAVEYLNHRLIYHLASGEAIEAKYRKPPFDVQAEELMRTGSFLKVSASYLINSQNVRGIKLDEFIMSNGAGYKITRNYSDAKQKYINGEMFRKNK